MSRIKGVFKRKPKELEPKDGPFDNIAEVIDRLEYCKKLGNIRFHSPEAILRTAIEVHDCYRLLAKLVRIVKIQDTDIKQLYEWRRRCVVKSTEKKRRK